MDPPQRRHQVLRPAGKESVGHPDKRVTGPTVDLGSTACAQHDEAGGRAQMQKIGKEHHAIPEVEGRKQGIVPPERRMRGDMDDLRVAENRGDCGWIGIEDKAAGSSGPPGRDKTGLRFDVGQSRARSGQDCGRRLWGSGAEARTGVGYP